MTTTLRTAVVGCGHFGRLHAAKWAALAGVELAAVCDRDLDRAERLADELGVPAFIGSRSLIGAVDAVSVVVPTEAHHAVAGPLLDAGIHCLVEKPLAASLEEAADLERRAVARRVVLQVGHLERFNPAFATALPLVGKPLFVEGHRLTPFRGRGTDVDVVLDLLVHDLDLLALLVGEMPAEVDAVGVPVLSERDDMVSVRLCFPGGCTANLTASRVSLKQERKLRLFGRDAYVAVDLGEGSVVVARKSSTGSPQITAERIEAGQGDPLGEEIAAFAAAIRNRTAPPVTAADGRRALELALRVSAALRRPA
ncbi:MAG TPA: Gfo/Idh/MocA family oxidoreductase [Geminicoccaceae bacterium]|nr:Gfo/Idh/MocA family oxidoreductase [Geminicoccus sp.]HMU52290.1 Gfo/Idh/MocA family oxidoreductase [Geminicoccaceae bacterium]